MCSDRLVCDYLYDELYESNENVLVRSGDLFLISLAGWKRGTATFQV